MKKIIAMLLALVMIMSMAACGNEDTEPTSTRAFEGTITRFTMSFGENADNIKSMAAYATDDGKVFVEYVGDDTKVGVIDADAFDGITKAFNKTELKTLDGTGWNSYGDPIYSMHVEFSGGETLAIAYVGEISDEYKKFVDIYINGYDDMDNHFKKLTESMQILTPQPYLLCNLDLNIVNEMLNVFNSSGMSDLDSFVINDLGLDDEGFVSTSGLTSANGAVNAVCATPRLTSDPYSMAVVEFEGAVNAETIGADFEKNIDWKKWDGAEPTDALIATKDNMVLCLQAAGDMYSMTVNGLNAEGWTVVNEFKNPGV
jgi:uncharacterized lipoprotein YehR (DUF1307 family)